MEGLDLVGSPAQPAPRPSAVTGPRTFEKRSDEFVVDLIADLVFRHRREGWTLTSPQAQVTVEKLLAGGVDLLFVALPQALGTEPGQALESDFKQTERLVGGTGGATKLVTSFKQAREVRASGAIPMMVLIEGADGLRGRLDRIGQLRRRGLGIVGVVAGRGNGFADAAVAPRDPGGLTEAGRQLLSACRDARVAVDLTHASPTAFWDGLVEQIGVVMVSHTAARALRDHPRNLDDLQILALSRYHGLLGLVFNPEFLRAGDSGSVTIDDVVAHIMHIKQIGALNALALGTDFNGIHPPRGLEDISKLSRLKNELAKQGMGDDEINAVFGANAARFFEEVERERGVVALTRDEILRPIPVECDGVVGESEGSAGLACNGLVLDQGARLAPSSRQKIRVRDMARAPVRLELFGEAGTPWQIEGQNLNGRVLLNRVIVLDDRGRGILPLPSGRNLTRLFCSPTRPSALNEIVVWGR